MYRNVSLFAVTMVIMTLELWYIFKYYIRRMIYSTFETKSHFGRYIRPKRSNLILRLAHGPLTGLVAKQAKCQHLPTSLLVLLKLLFNLHAARKRYSKKGH